MSEQSKVQPVQPVTPVKAPEPSPTEVKPLWEAPRTETGEVKR